MADMESVATGGRSGPFWDGVRGRVPMPPAAATLGFEFIDADVDEGTIEVAFTATEEFTNPLGNVLGAFLAAMLYDTVGPALLATLRPDQFQSTVELKASFLRPVRPGRLVGRGRVVHRAGDLAFLEASLSDQHEVTVATATATARVIGLEEALSAA
ncbi:MULTISPECIES: PaaI family thioesterase [Thermomonospora]|uniref:Thioesterase superfamily protein n=1 Tax=Thermomonospora curvata (strain ATCC 19995 / DSM 43183 / JCM 3096 / KCTC 9072 / NBRC 15933 / NCIMB 10081 / Henssen B9) TaxID=471852 RepID=D1A880_THECD|nr:MULTISPECIES: PaaI family thioesterase [Thermomonospora]ACZ00395.1 thioesterase superfamily protein [Thermomonospora curvata DSM 43183]PKK11877.1 MAG: phenylacetic acid degradation protein [Thermomonospora sp. CIF 1]